MVTKAQLKKLGWSHDLIDAVFKACDQIDWDKIDRPPRDKTPLPSVATSNKMVVGEYRPNTSVAWVLQDERSKNP